MAASEANDGLTKLPAFSPLMLRHLPQLLLWAALTTVTLLPTHAQLIQATVLVIDARTSKPIPYASVGVCGKPLGTVANATGTFPLSQVVAALLDSVAISCVGYQPRKLLARQLSLNVTLRLEPVATTLAEVIVHGRQPKVVVLGHRNASLFSSFGFYTQTDTVPHARLGREMGVLLDVRHPTELQSFHVLTFGRDFQSVIFRLNLYAVKNSTPQNTLLRHDIIFTVNGQQRGWTEVDLRPYTIMLTGEQQVVASIESLANVPARHIGGFLSVPGHVSATHSLFMRDKSAQGWHKLGLNPNMYFKGLAHP